MKNQFHIRGRRRPEELKKTTGSITENRYKLARSNLAYCKTASL